MSIAKSGASAIGKMLIVLSLTAAFLGGMLVVVYMQLKGEEVEIPKVVGKNFNDGREDLAGLGLRIKKIAGRYSNEEPNTILEQRPRAGTTAKTGLMISVVVSEKNPDGSEVPMDIKDDQEAIEEIEEQPELKIDKVKPKAKPKKSDPKTRDVIKKKDDDSSGTDGSDSKPAGDGKEGDGSQKGGDSKPPAVDPKNPPKPPAGDKKETPKPKTSGDTRSRTVDQGN